MPRPGALVLQPRLSTEKKPFIQKKNMQKYLAMIILPGSTIVKIRLPMGERQETWVQSLGREDPLELKMATHSRILAWDIPWREEPGGLQPRCHNKEEDTIEHTRRRNDNSTQTLRCLYRCDLVYLP